jgi:hypothetical protein
VYSIAGFVVLHVLGRLLLTAYALGHSEGELWRLSPGFVEAVAGPVGVLVGGLWLAAGQTLLRGGLGALLGLYLSSVVSFAWPGSNALAEEVQLGLLAIVAGATVIPLLSAIPVRGMIRAAAAALPGVVLIQLFRLNPLLGSELFFFRLCLLSVLLALPLAGLAHRSQGSSGTVSLSIVSTNVSLPEILRLGGTGIVGAAFMSLVVGLAVLIGSRLTPLIAKMTILLLDLPIAEALLSAIGLDGVRIPVDPLWMTVLTFYTSVASVGWLARSGMLHALYRFLRFLTLILVCCLIALLTEQALEVVLRDWPAFQPFGDYLLQMGYGLPAGAVLLGAIFAIVYVGDRMPMPLIGLGFAIWLGQLVLLSSVLAFVGGVVGLWASPLVGPFLDSQSPEGVYGMSWQQVLPLASSYLGFFVGLGRALLKWLGGDLGMLVSEYRRVAQRYFGLVDTRVNRLLQLRAPWWATVAFGAATVWAMKQFTGLMMPVLVQRF